MEVPRFVFTRCLKHPLIVVVTVIQLYGQDSLAQALDSVKKPPHAISIEAQSLDTALTYLAQTTGVQVVVESVQTRALETKTLEGFYTVDEALVFLLEPLNLYHFWVNDRMIAVVAESSKLPTASPTPQAENFPDTEDAIDVITVIGVRSSIIDALVNKIYETRVTDSIQAEDLGEFPDLNLAESLQRVPGVSLEMSFSGSSRTITVRGLSSQFTRVELNGMGGATGGGGRSGAIDTLTSGAGNDGRHFNFDVLPSELFTSVVIAKSAQAQDAEGGIAALVELASPSPFNMDETNGSVTAQGNWGEETRLTPRVSGLWVKNINDDFAILIGGVYAKNKSQTNEIGFNRLVPLSNRIADPTGFSDAELNARLPEWGQTIVRVRKTELFSALTTIEWRPSDASNVRFDAIYTMSEGFEEAAQGIYVLSTVVPTSLTLDGDVITAATFSNFNQSQLQFQFDGIDDELQQYTLDADFGLGEFAGGIWSVNPFLGYNKREVSRPFRQLDYFGSGGEFAYELSNSFANFTTTAPNFGSDELSYRLDSSFAADNVSDSNQFDVKLNFEGEYYNDILKTIRIGARYTNRETNNGEPFFGATNFAPTPRLAELGDFLGTRDIDFGGAIPNQIFFLNTQATALFLQNGQELLDQDRFDLSKTQLSGIVIGSAAVNATTFSTVSEETLAGYIEADFEIEDLFVNVGVRLINTEVSASSTALSNGSLVPVEFTSDYTKTLPAVNVKYTIADDLFIRGAYSTALSRPSMTDLAPRQTINFEFITNPVTGEIATEGSIAQGNPELEPFVVDQFEIGFEWYFHPEGLIALTFFNKNFSSVIATDLLEDQIVIVPSDSGDQTGKFDISLPTNTGEASVNGSEFTAQSSLFYFGKAFEDFGILFNYTNLNFSVALSNLNGELGREQFQPFTNLSPSSFNAGVYFDNGTFDARLNYAWREGFLKDLLDPADNGRFQEDYGQLDLTMNYALTENLNFQLQVTNLLDEELEFASSQARLPIAAVNAERRAVFGLRTKF